MATSASRSARVSNTTGLPELGLYFTCKPAATVPVLPSLRNSASGVWAEAGGIGA